MKNEQLKDELRGWISKEDIHDFIDRVFDDCTDKESGHECLLSAHYLVNHPIPFAMRSILGDLKYLYDCEPDPTANESRDKIIKGLAGILGAVTRYFKYDKYVDCGYLEYTDKWFDATLPRL